MENAIEKESSNGNVMIELQLRVKGLLIYDNLVFTDKSFWKIDAFRVCTGEKLVPGEVVVFNSDDCIGRRGRAVVMIDSFQRRSRNKIAEYLPPSDGDTPGSNWAGVPATPVKPSNQPF